MNRWMPVALMALSGLGACRNTPNESVVHEVPVGSIPGHDSLDQDNTPKEGPRLLPPEVYIRTYLTLFGGLAPLPAQDALRGTSGGVFDTWNDYLNALGLPDYRVDIPRGSQTNALMLATFERVGIALCDRALEHDLHGTTPPPIDQRLIYAFDNPATPLDQAGFTTRFDVMHRTFLGYPAAMAPPDRVGRFFTLYSNAASAHMLRDAGSSRFTPTEVGWALVCYGLVRHPEFHMY